MLHMTTFSFQITIEATVRGWRGDIAIDEIEFTSGQCPVTSNTKNHLTVTSLDVPIHGGK